MFGLFLYIQNLKVKEIEKKLHDVMIDWYFEQTKEKIWLGSE
ncbi:hypothetical protein FLACHUCJ7_04587 [Flavobacterium chungangense]|uniref:Uncharacterized protein n=1 Tax=Flavobacterium chungangense TaxID=554283 RepID=A0A6V6ZDS3_9FLAO|nr:hypothetical protein FLACHUCJ7_04587 [Flavobacterium chungangense]